MKRSSETIDFETILPRLMSDLAERLLQGDKRALARGISLVEDDDPAGWELVKAVYPKTGNAAVGNEQRAHPEMRAAVRAPLDDRLFQ